MRQLGQGLLGFPSQGQGRKLWAAHQRPCSKSKAANEMVINRWSRVFVFSTNLLGSRCSGQQGTHTGAGGRDQVDAEEGLVEMPIC